MEDEKRPALDGSHDAMKFAKSDVDAYRKAGDDSIFSATIQESVSADDQKVTATAEGWADESITAFDPHHFLLSDSDVVVAKKIKRLVADHLTWVANNESLHDQKGGEPSPDACICPFG